MKRTCGARYFIRIASALMNGDMTTNELARHIGISRGSAFLSLYQLHAAGLVHICARKGSHGSNVFRWGPGDDVVYRDKVPTTQGVRDFAAILRLLQSGDISRYGYGSDVGLCDRSVSRFITEALAWGVVYVSGWEKLGKTTTALYTWGRGKSAPKPPIVCRKEVCRKSRAARQKRKAQVEMLSALRPDLLRKAA